MLRGRGGEGLAREEIFRSATLETKTTEHAEKKGQSCLLTNRSSTPLCNG